MDERTEKRIAELVADWPQLSDALKDELALLLSDDVSLQGGQDRTGSCADGGGTAPIAAP